MCPENRQAGASEWALGMKRITTSNHDGKRGRTHE
jgi:hypothetical protein